MGRGLNTTARRGSALLIVLGMVAFMIISAVAFSAYMRLSRLPSSYVRRQVSTRMLVKAALAQAIDEVDAAIGNNPHPGVGTLATTYPRRTGLSYNRNQWLGRVYLGTNTTQLVAQNETISPLCLEALAYLPPNLVNDVRYYSRHSTAAKRHTLPYDAGSFTFCAVDVSDYFDVNALRADTARSSAADSRISLAYLFENEKHTSGSGTVDPQVWDQQMAAAYKAAGKVPLVSMADWNLMMNSSYSPDNNLSPFCKYLQSANGSMFYTGALADYEAQRLTFVTDSYMPKSAAATKEKDALEDLDISQSANQPFSGLQSATSGNLSLINLLKGGSAESAKRIWRAVSGLGLAALYDYLDRDSVPCSLAIPTTERVPMFCGIKPTVKGVTLKAETTSKADPATDTAQETDPETRTKTMVYTFKLTGLNALKVGTIFETLLCYPFRSYAGLAINDFTLDGRASFFFSKIDNPVVAFADNDALDIDTAAEFKQARDTIDYRQRGVFSVPLSIGKSPFSSSIQNESEAIKSINATLDDFAVDDNFMTVTYEWKQTKKAIGDGEVKTYVYEPALDDVEVKNMNVSVSCNFNPLEAGGAIVDLAALVKKAIMGDDSAVQVLKNGFQLNMAVWLRVADKNSKTVDLVPASVRDDILNGYVANRVLVSQLGQERPLLKFNLGATMTINAGKSPSFAMTVPEAAVSGCADGIMVADPRYNHAPNDWFKVSGGFSADNWLANCHRKTENGVVRDGDIFLSVSDQGWLQSVYELANLPRLKNSFTETMTDSLLGDYVSPNDYGTGIQDTFENTLHNGLVWRSYSPFFDMYRSDGDDFEKLGLVNDDAGCYKMTPYANANDPTGTTNILMAAFANTPYEWRFAAPDPVDALSGMPDDSTFNDKYAWNEYSSGLKMKWDDLSVLAAAFKSSILKYGNFEDAWNELATDGNAFSAGGDGWYVPGDTAPEEVLCGVELGGAKLYNCDKKFLYGYWRECFATESRQQLFLVFVRAEPYSMGGDTIYLNPPMHGTKAVALVWRDPTATSQPYEPHRTRVLFYRQFD